MNRNDVTEKIITAKVTKTKPVSVMVTSKVHVTVPSLQFVTQTNTQKVTIVEPTFQTVSVTPPPLTRVSYSAIVQTVTDKQTVTAEPQRVFVSTTVIQF